MDDMLRAVADRTFVTYDGGDTGFLNARFPQWFASPPDNRLPFQYNAQRTLYWYTHSKQPGYWDVGVGEKKILHFSSSPKPWQDPNRRGDLELLWWTQLNENTAWLRSTRRR
jgi:glycogenin